MASNNFFVKAISCVVLLTTSATAHSHGAVEDRLHTANHAIEHMPEKALNYVRRGRVFQDSGQWDKALQDFARALKVDPTHHEALYWKGRTLLKKGDPVQAQKIIHEYLIQKPHSPAGHRTIAQAYFQMGDLLKAADHYDQSINNDKKPSPQVYLERSQVLFNIKPIPAERISSGLVAAIQKNGKIITFIDLLISLNIQLNNYQEASLWIDKLPGNLNTTPHWILKKAEMEELQGNRQQTLILYQQALSSIKRLPKNKQNLPIFIDIRQKAEQGIKGAELK